MSDTTAAVFLVMALALPLSALLARRIPLGTTAKMALAWIAIFAVCAILVSQYERMRSPKSNASSTQAPD